MWYNVDERLPMPAPGYIQASPLVKANLSNGKVINAYYFRKWDKWINADTNKLVNQKVVAWTYGGAINNI